MKNEILELVVDYATARTRYELGVETAKEDMQKALDELFTYNPLDIDELFTYTH